jgi:RimJ/RimL family protein N-acetyltransferase
VKLTELHGARLRLRCWRAADLDPFAALSADPEAMDFFPATLSRAESAAMIERLQARIDAQGWGLWCADIDGHCAGFIGLAVPSFEAPFTPCVEIGWRLARRYWGQGYATEGARLALAFGFSALGLAEIVSFTAVANQRSRRVMEKLGMTRDPADDFDHPKLPAGHPLQRHVLYRLRAPAI